LLKPLISCHKHNLKPILTDYIYLNFGKKAKGQTLQDGFALIEKTISQQFQGYDIYIFIADIGN
jgi:hypothetical protein